MNISEQKFFIILQCFQKFFVLLEIKILPQQKIYRRVKTVDHPINTSPYRILTTSFPPYLKLTRAIIIEIENIHTFEL